MISARKTKLNKNRDDERHIKPEIFKNFKRRQIKRASKHPKQHNHLTKPTINQAQAQKNHFNPHLTPEKYQNPIKLQHFPTTKQNHTKHKNQQKLN